MINIIIYCLIGFLSNGSTTEEFIEWKADRPLQWEDFKGAPDKNSSNAALTSSGLQADFSFGSKGLSFKIKCRFNKNRSWVKIKTNTILNHEQGHFDITEIFARKFNKALTEYVYKEKTVEEDLQKIYQEILTEHHQWQQTYDKETSHSILTEQQKNWEEKIAETIKGLDAYKNYH